MKKILFGLLLALAFWAQPSFAAYAFVAQGSQADAGSATGLSYSPTYGAGEYGIAWGTYGSGTTIAETISDGVNTWTKVASYNDATDDQSWVVFYCGSLAAGSPAGSFNLVSGAPFRGIGYLRYTGLDAAAVPVVVWTNNSAPGSGTDAVTSGTLTVTSQPGVLIGLSMDASGSETTLSAGSSPFTSRSALAAWVSNISSKNATEDKRITATGSVAATFTAGSGAGTFASFAIYITEPGASGGGGSVAPSGMLLRGGGK